MECSLRSSLVVGVVVALALTACVAGGGAGDADDVGAVTLSFTWWGNDDRAAKYEEVLDLFEADHPDITVQTSFAAFPDYWTARATEAAGRALPDVLQFDLSYLREYGRSDHLLDLTPYVEDGMIDLAGVDENLLGSGVLDGERIGIPTSTNALAMFVNPGLRDQVGIEFPDQATYTYEDLNAFVTAAAEAGASTPDGYQVYGSADYTATFWFFIQWLVQQGIDPFDEDGTLNFDEADVVEYLELTGGLRARQQVFPAARTTALLPLTGFAVDEVVSEMTWDNFLSGYEADSGTTDLELVLVPSVEPGHKRMFAKPSMLLSAGANTDHPDEAAALIDFLLTDERVGEIFGTSRGVPADSGQRAAISAEPGSVDARVLEFEERSAQYVTAGTPIPVLGFGTIEAKWLTLSEEVGHGNITPEQFAEQWFAEAEMAIG